MAAKVIKETLYVRVPRKHKSDIEKYARKLDVTQNQVIENIIGFFMTLDGADREDIINGKSSRLGSTSNIGAALECLAWAEHSFVRGHYEWSLEGWRSLQAIAEQTQSVDLERLAHYKQTLCLNKLAIGLRDEVLEQAAISLKATGEIASETWAAGFSEADNALDSGIIHNEIFQRLSNNYYHPVITYNTSCQYSLKSQFLVEKFVLSMPKHNSILLRTKSSIDEERSMKISPDEALWKHLGPIWKDDVDEEAVEQIRHYGRSSVEGLLTIIKKGGTGDHGKPAPVTDESFLLRYSGRDRDLLFVMHDPVIRKLYDDRVGGYKGRTRLESFLKLWEKESPEVRDRIKPVSSKKTPTRSR